MRWGEGSKRGDKGKEVAGEKEMGEGERVERGLKKGDNLYELIYVCVHVLVCVCY